MSMFTCSRSDYSTLSRQNIVYFVPVKSKLLLQILSRFMNVHNVNTNSERLISAIDKYYNVVLNM